MFTNNLPGAEWAYSLLKRPKSKYSQRIIANIKKARVDLSRESLDEYFNNLEKVIKAIPLANILNYDESNNNDDPGKKIGIYNSGFKYPQNAMNFFKSVTTFMVCGSADGILLPPYMFIYITHG